MLTVSKPAQFWWPVDVPVPADNGTIAYQTIQVRFQALPDDKRAEMMESQITDAGFTKAVVVDWSDGIDEAFSADALDQLLNNHPYVGRAIVEAYFGATNGQEYVAKNSSTPSAPGRVATKAKR